MENFVLGLLSIGLELQLFLRTVAFHPTSIGFVAGFFAATAIYLFILFEEKGHIVSILLERAPEACYQKLSERAPEGSLEIPYEEFIKLYNRVRILFFSAATVFLIALVVIFLKTRL
ncbi:hypothetical protein FJZ23_02520 [Candidatus Parcubacteria bacterium]|nr:hypothetical protein [Candidatus Parcubacteria bacterium]